jgi:large subunit ribosomal protein L22
MVHKVKLKYARLSPRKAIPIARLIKGLSLEEAMARTSVSREKASKLFFELLKSAKNNLVQNHKLEPERFVITNCAIEQGPQIKRYWARSRGMAHPITKKMAHMIIELEDLVKVKKQPAATTSAKDVTSENRKE